MSVKFSLTNVKTTQLGFKARTKPNANAIENPLDERKPRLADFEDSDEDESSDILKSKQEGVVLQGENRLFAVRARSNRSGPGTLPVNSGSGSSLISSRPPGPQAYGFNRGPHRTDFNTVVARASNLPPTMQKTQIEELFAQFPNLKVQSVEKLEPVEGDSEPSKGAISMKIGFEEGTTAKDLEAAMLQMSDKRYLGSGRYLHLDRYFPGQNRSARNRKLPFGARMKVIETADKGFAPSEELGGNRNQIRAQHKLERPVVTVRRPQDLATLKLIHRTVEGVMRSGPEFEEALMNVPRVQEQEQFAWLFDQTHPLNKYYRWRLHELVCGPTNSEPPQNELVCGPTRSEPFHIFDDGVLWEGPEGELPDEFVHDMKSLDPEQPNEAADDKTLHYVALEDSYPGMDDSGNGILPPRSRVYLMWLLKTMPVTPISNLGVAPYGQFAIEHARKGADEIVHLLVSNVFQPFRLQAAEGQVRKSDRVTVATLNALYIISDVARTTGQNKKWATGKAYKYRPAIGTQLLQRKVFEYLDTFSEQLEMVPKDKFQRDVNSIIEIWTLEVLFDTATLAQFDATFNKSARERQAKKDEERAERKRKRLEEELAKTEGTELVTQGERPIRNPRFRKVGKSTSPSDEKSVSTTSRMDVVDEKSARATSPMDIDNDGKPQADTIKDEVPGETAAARALRQRPKAEDMFASD
ncbi:hypothetical protein BDV95DRAFT_570732 [Massariosphaeria phaeospora]|uniref:SURP motif domain-containing protein n=1 Tax=Massariosphaeria phaeospora TaxID=100035 RepID=A0A7C8I9T6_9PLEO|nr:hypothetical protein BDV95DRAFT_570732 [Massariosphaeria phaeospora]